MSDITQSPYAEWLENFCRQVVEMEPDRIGVCVINEDAVLTAYYGEMCPEDKAVMAYHLQSDAIMDTVLANARSIVEAAEEDDAEIS